MSEDTKVEHVAPQGERVDRTDRPERSSERSERPAGDRDNNRRGPGGRDNRRGGPGGNRRRGGFRRRRRHKVSKFDEWGIKDIDYKDERLKEFLSEHGKILSRRVTGSRAKHQRRLTRAIKRARYMALLPYVGKVEKNRDRN